MRCSRRLGRWPPTLSPASRQGRSRLSPPVAARAIVISAVSAAKAALESHTRQLALELGPAGVMINCIEAGVTDTPALRKIPGHEAFIEMATRFNPTGRMTTEPDVAVTIAALSDPRVRFMSGSVIYVDGGEDVVGA